MSILPDKRLEIKTIVIMAILAALTIPIIEKYHEAKQATPAISEKEKQAAKQAKEFRSPNGKYLALVIPYPKAPHGAGESRIEIHSGDAIVSSASYSSEDGEHGFGVERAAWSPDSKFFVYSMSSSGGHQAWHFPTYFVSVDDFKTRYLDNYVGSITLPEITFISPDTVQVYGHMPSDFEKETEIKASLSKLLK